MGKYSNMLYVLTLASVLLLSQATALDVWGGSNANEQSLVGATAQGGLQILSTATSLNYNLFSSDTIAANSVGWAYSDWNIPSTVTVTGKVTSIAQGIDHDLMVQYGGHIQTGISGTSTPAAVANPLVLPLSTAAANIQAIAAVPQPVVNPYRVQGSATISSSLNLYGKTEGYAIANGLAAYSADSKEISTNDEYTSIEGAAIGTISLNGRGGMYSEQAGPAGNIASTHSTGTATISSTSDIQPINGEQAPVTNSQMSVTGGSVDYNQVAGAGNPNAPDGNTNLSWSVTGSSTAAGWGTWSPVIKTLNNVDSMTDITNANLVGMLNVYKRADIAAGLPVVGTIVPGGIVNGGVFARSIPSAVIGNPSAIADLVTSASATRTTAANNANRVVAESFINGGTYDSTYHAFNNVQSSLSGTIGWTGFVPGLGSGAHLATVTPAAVNSFALLDQEAFSAMAAAPGSDTISAPRTIATYSSITNGPLFTNNILDDAGSQIGTNGYTTSSSTAFTTFSTTLGSYYDVNWVNGKQINMPRFDSSITFTDNPTGSARYNIVSTGTYLLNNRVNTITKSLTQTYGV